MAYPPLKTNRKKLLLISHPLKRQIRQKIQNQSQVTSSQNEMFHQSSYQKQNQRQKRFLKKHVS